MRYCWSLYLYSMTKNTINTDSSRNSGGAKKPFDQLTPLELEEVQRDFRNEVRQRAWSVGSPVYYGEKGLLIAEYESGKKMVVEEVNGALVETREYAE